MTLRDVINRLESVPDGLVIFASKNDEWNLDGPAALVNETDVSKTGTTIEELRYFLEVDVGKEVLAVWKQWRNGMEPSEKDRVEALIYYADNDAYIA